MNNIKKKIFLYAIAAPVLLAVFGCENKCAPATETPVMEQTAEAKVDAIWKKLNEKPPKMAEVAKLIKTNIKDNPAAAKMLAEKMTEKGDTFFCLYLGQKLDQETAEAIGLVIDLLSSKDSEKAFDMVCKADDGKKVTPLERLTDDARSTGIADEPAALNATINKVMEKSPDAAVLRVQSATTGVDKLARAAASSTDRKVKAVLYNKMKMNLPKDKEEQFNDAMLASDGADFVDIDVTSKKVIKEAKKALVDWNTGNLKKYYQQLVKKDRNEIDSMVLADKDNFVDLLANLPATPDTLEIWTSLKDTVAERHLTTALSKGVTIDAKPFVKLLRRTAELFLLDDQPSLKEIVRLMIEGREVGMFALVRNNADVDAYFGALLDHEDALRAAYVSVNFVPHKKEVMKLLAENADKASVRSLVRENIGNNRKISIADFIRIIRNRPTIKSNLPKAMYDLLVAEGGWVSLDDAQRREVAILFAARDASDLFDVYRDMIAQERVRTDDAGVVNHIIEVMRGANVLTKPFNQFLNGPRPATETPEARQRLIALMFENGNNGTADLVDNQDRINLVMDSISNYGGSVDQKRRSFIKLASRADNLSPMAIWAVVPGRSDETKDALTNGATSPLRPQVFSFKMLANAAARAQRSILDDNEAPDADLLAIFNAYIQLKKLDSMNALTFRNLAITKPEEALLGVGSGSFLEAMLSLPLDASSTERLANMLREIKGDNVKGLNVVLGATPVGYPIATPFRALIKPTPKPGGDDVPARQRLIAKVVDLSSNELIASVDNGNVDVTKANIDNMLDAVLSQRFDPEYNVSSNLRKVFVALDLTKTERALDALAQWMGKNWSEKIIEGTDVQSIIMGVNLPVENFKRYALYLAGLGLDDVSDFRVSGLATLLIGKKLTETDVNEIVPEADNILHKLTAKITTSAASWVLMEILQSMKPVPMLARMRLRTADNAEGSEPFKRLLNSPVELPFANEPIAYVLKMGADLLVPLINAPAELKLALKSSVAVPNQPIGREALKQIFNNAPEAARGDIIDWLKSNAGLLINQTNNPQWGNDTVAVAFAYSDVQVSQNDVTNYLVQENLGSADSSNQSNIAALYALFTRYANGNAARGDAGDAEIRNASASLGRLDIDGSLFIHHLADRPMFWPTYQILIHIIDSTKEIDTVNGNTDGMDRLLSAAVAGKYNGLTPLQILTGGNPGTAREGEALQLDHATLKAQALELLRPPVPAIP